jgi:hypothetical protein
MNTTTKNVNDLCDTIAIAIADLCSMLPETPEAREALLPLIRGAAESFAPLRTF